MNAAVSIRDGAVYLPAAVADTYFAGVDAVILLVRDGQLLVLPVRGTNAGGCLLKIINRAGDRVARAPDAFAEAGIERLEATGLPAKWVTADAALAVTLPGSRKAPCQPSKSMDSHLPTCFTE